MKHFLVTYFIFIVTNSFGCECGNYLGANFYKNIGYFDLIAMGTFDDLDSLDDEAYFNIERTFKGKTKTNKIKIVGGGINCTIIPSSSMFNPESTYIIGLKGSDIYSIPSCIYSILKIKDNQAYGVLNYSTSFLRWLGIQDLNSVSVNKLDRKKDPKKLIIFFCYPKPLFIQIPVKMKIPFFVLTIHLVKSQDTLLFDSGTFKEIGFTVGYNCNIEDSDSRKYHLVEFGIIRSTYNNYHHPVSSSIYFSSELALNTVDFVWGLK